MEFFKAAGGDVLAMCMSNLIHEVEGNVFRMDEGDGITDFTECTNVAGLPVIAQPEPKYNNANVIYNTLPARLVKKDPEILSFRRGGSHYGIASKPDGNQNLEFVTPEDRKK